MPTWEKYEDEDAWPTELLYGPPRGPGYEEPWRRTDFVWTVVDELELTVTKYWLETTTTRLRMEEGSTKREANAAMRSAYVGVELLALKAWDEGVLQIRKTLTDPEPDDEEALRRKGI